MGYANDDLKRLWRIIQKKITADSRYLARMKRVYEKTYAMQERYFVSLSDVRIKRLADRALCAAFRKTVRAQIDAVGIAHMLEPIGIEIEHDIKKCLYKEIRDPKELRHALSLLLSPTAASFLAQEEMDLYAIKSLPESRQKAALKAHSKRYAWIQHSYVGPVDLSASYFAKRMKLLDISWKSLAAERKELIQRLKLSARAKRLLDIIDLTARWQDERKANILKMIGHMGRVLSELSKRTGVSVELLSYCGIRDVYSFSTLSDVSVFQKQLRERRRGVFFLMNDTGDYPISGGEYRSCVGAYESYRKKGHQQTREIHGSCAMLGVVVGRAKICKNLESIHTVKNGDILVTSMTRPEFMPALKRASGIVTDEGGVTCHAAIVARELGIPAVIGTRHATAILKDGMLVEIRAHHGLVKILE
ncbi:hypothetical protein HY627_00565 [Candidatus Uhrbacteria bacterium]|nr:hypothetical protein [Candidatus Uhrbacteria bacterium]